MPALCHGNQLTQGSCNRDHLCKFAHSQSELAPSPNLSKTKLCSYYSKGSCPNGLHCGFAHGEQELRATSDYYKTEICKEFVEGYCKFGDRCRFAHGFKELRNKPEPSPFVVKPKKFYSNLKNPSQAKIEDISEKDHSKFFETKKHKASSTTWRDIYYPLSHEISTQSGTNSSFKFEEKIPYYQANSMFNIGGQQAYNIQYNDKNQEIPNQFLSSHSMKFD